MADRFAEIESFVKIAESGTLSEAAKRLGLSLAATSRRLSQLEQRLGVMLIRRNSRHLSLTDEGSLLYEGAGRALSAIDDIETDVMRRATEASGPLRVVTTIGAARMRLAPIFRQYATLHPDVTVHLETAEQATNIVESGHDIALCFDPPPDSALTMKRLTDNPRLLCAAPDYLNRRGRPGSVHDLAVHDNIVAGQVQQDLWRSLLGDAPGPRVTLSTNDGELARAWALDGAGIVLKSMWEVSDDLDAGRLQPVLPDVALPPASIVALYMPGQGEMAKVRSCLDFLARHLSKGLAAA
ncbi:LysR family transcriptional regulator [Sphingobium sp.]|uniref:LysR family transcriptional regulator n=1 Tax=Sphingobium sp. TaxID=1912891 RepID=UPI00260A8B33|nr:LysR family transcriptional regulator [Sphingobium sp.]